MNDDSEESRAKLQEITVSLKEAKENLQETEYDKFISDQTALLDELFLEYENVLNTRLENTDGLIREVIAGVNAAAGAIGEEGVITTALGSEGAIAKALGSNTTTIKSTLETEAKNVGATLSTAMKGIWSVDEGNAKSVITQYGKGFQDKQTTTNTVLGDIKAYINRMVDDIDKDANKNINSNKTSSSAKKDPSAKSMISSVANAVKNAAKSINDDDVIKGIAAAIWIYGKDSGWGNNPFRENKLTNKLGASNAQKVQDYVNKYGASGELYNFWLKKNKNLKKYYYNAFVSGARKIDETQLAWTQEKGQEFIVRPSDGAILTPIAKGDSVLNANASSNIWDMANSPADFIKDNLKLGAANNVPNNANISNSTVQNFENITFSMPNVRNYEQLLSEMQKDKSFEKLILAMTVDRIAGGSSLAKNKSIR